MFKNRKRMTEGSQQGNQLYVSTGQTARDAEKIYQGDNNLYT